MFASHVSNGKGERHVLKVTAVNVPNTFVWPNWSAIAWIVFDPGTEDVIVTLQVPLAPVTHVLAPKGSKTADPEVMLNVTVAPDTGV